jgi:hypothetical protein
MKEVVEFHELAAEEESFPLDPCCEASDVFSCSSGDDSVKSFQCPALEEITFEELQRESTFKAEALTLRRASHRKFYNEVDEDEEEEEDDNDDSNLDPPKSPPTCSPLSKRQRADDV